MRNTECRKSNIPIWGDIVGDIKIQKDLMDLLDGYLNIEALREAIQVEDAQIKEWVEEQGYLTEHQELKTINNQSIVGEGNIEIQGGGSSAVIYEMNDFVITGDVFDNIVRDFNDKKVVRVRNNSGSSFNGLVLTLNSYSPRNEFNTYETLTFSVNDDMSYYCTRWNPEDMIMGLSQRMFLSGDVSNTFNFEWGTITIGEEVYTGPLIPNNGIEYYGIQTFFTETMKPVKFNVYVNEESKSIIFSRVSTITGLVNEGDLFVGEYTEIILSDGENRYKIRISYKWDEGSANYKAEYTNL